MGSVSRHHWSPWSVMSQPLVLGSCVTGGDSDDSDDSGDGGDGISVSASLVTLVTDVTWPRGH